MDASLDRRNRRQALIPALSTGLLNTFETDGIGMLSPRMLGIAAVAIILGPFAAMPSAKGSGPCGSSPRLAVKAGTVQLLIGQLQQAMTSFPTLRQLAHVDAAEFGARGRSGE